MLRSSAVKRLRGSKSPKTEIHTAWLRLSRSQTGIGKLTLLVFGVLIAVTLYAGYHITPFYYYYYELENQFQSVIRIAGTESDGEIRRRLMYHIKKYQMPIEPEELKIMREEGKLKISLKYEEVFYVSFQDRDYEVYTFPFHAYAEGDY